MSRRALLITALFALSHAALAQDEGVVVQLAIAERQRLIPETWVPGTVVSRFDSRVAAEVQGVLLTVVEVGDRVREGDPLGQIDDQSHQIRLRNDEARMRRLEANIAFLDRQLARFTELVATNSSAELEVDRVRMEREMAVQDLAAAEAERDQTRYLIERTRITAPFDGVIAERMAHPGEFIGAGAPLVRLVNERLLEATVQAPVTTVRHVRPGAEVAVANDVLERRATLRAVVPVGDERSRMVELRIALGHGAWTIGEAVRASIPSAAAVDAVTVPRDALVLRDSQVYVFRIGADGIAERVRVVPGPGSADLISVQGALEGGDRVVVRGAENLQNGQLVKVLSGAVTDDRAASV